MRAQHLLAVFSLSRLTVTSLKRSGPAANLDVRSGHMGGGHISAWGLPTWVALLRLPFGQQSIFHDVGDAWHRDGRDDVARRLLILQGRGKRLEVDVLRFAE